MKDNKTKKLVMMAMFIAISFIGANIKIFGGSIAFDSMPGFLGAMMLGPVYGAIIGAIGHLLTAITSGFPLTIPVHSVIAINMAVTMLVFGYIYNYFKAKKSKVTDIVLLIVGTLLNAPISTYIVSFVVPAEMKAGIIAMIPILTAAAIFNILLALILVKAIPTKYVE